MKFLLPVLAFAAAIFAVPVPQGTYDDYGKFHLVLYSCHPFTHTSCPLYSPPLPSFPHHPSSTTNLHHKYTTAHPPTNHLPIKAHTPASQLATRRPPLAGMHLMGIIPRRLGVMGGMGHIRNKPRE
jgi:hypothetical protein